MELTDIDLGWVAGFIEGEGSFQWARVTPSVTVSQVQREPLEKLLKLCGGNIYHISRKTDAAKWSDYDRWYIYGDGAYELIRLIYPLLSPRRKEQAKVIYTKRYRQINKPKIQKTHCDHGHVLTADNILKSSRGDRACRICHKKQNNEYSARKREVTVTKQKEQ